MSNEHNPLQREIETILLDTDSTVPERIALLKDLFEREKILLFTDFDDTVVDSSCVFFGRLTLLERLGKLDTPEEGKNIIDEVLMRYFAINPHFSRVLADGNFSGKMVVISRNYHALIRRFVLHAELYLSNTGYTNISIVGGIGQIPGIFTYRSRDKLAFLPKWSVLVADSFEHESVRSAGHVVLVGQCGRYGTLWLYITKIIRMIGYLGRITLFRKPY